LAIGHIQLDRNDSRACLCLKGVAGRKIPEAGKNRHASHCTADGTGGTDSR